MRKYAAPLALAGYLLLTLLLTYPLVRQFGSAIPGDGFDGWQNYWNLWWMKVALLEQGSSPYFTNLLYAPTGVSLLFHTLNPFNGLWALPVQLAWGLLPAYNAAVVFSFVAGGFGAYLLARQVLAAVPLRATSPAQGDVARRRRPGSYLAPFTAGVIFTFAPFHVAHLLGHLQMISLEWLPFYALYITRLALHGGRAGRGWLKDGLLAGLFLVLIALCDWYFVLYGLIFTGLVLLWAAVRYLNQSMGEGRTGQRMETDTCPTAWRSAGKRIVTRAYPFIRDYPLQYAPWTEMARLAAGTAVAGLVFALLTAPVLAPMLREAGRSTYMVPDPLQSRTLSADLLGFVTPQEFHPLWGAWARTIAGRFTASLAEHQVFAGYTVLLLAVLGVWAARRRRSRAAPPGGSGARPSPADTRSLWLLAALVFAVLALGPVLHINGQAAWLPGGRELPLPYGWLAGAVPFLNISRSLSRFDVMVMLALAVLAGFGLQWLSARGKAGYGLAWGALALVVLEFWPAPYPLSTPDTPGWYSTLAADPHPGSVLNLPMNWDRPGYLLYQTVHRKPLTVAYISRDDPRTLVDRAPILQQLRHLGPDIIELDVARQGQQVLADLGVRWVVLDRYKMPGARERGYNEDLARQIFMGQPPVYQDPRLTVYQVVPPDPGEAYLVLGTGWGPYNPNTGQRTFWERGPLVVQAPRAGRTALHVTLAPGSAPLDGPGDGPEYVLPLDLQAGSHEIVLRSRQPGQNVAVTRLALEPVTP